MSTDLPTLRAQVEAVQALAAKATPGPWIVHPRTHTSGWGTCVGPPGEMIARMTGGRGSSPKQRAKDAAMLAAAPDLVTHLTDALALAESQGAELTAIRAALGNGADEAAWPPGVTVWKCGAVVRERTVERGGYMVTARDRCILLDGHEGPHAEALAAGNDGEDDGA